MNHKAKVVFADEVWDQIEWFTYNFDTEIGALGIVKQKKGEDGEKYFYVEELLFPQQKVSGATVHFTPEMWGDLLKERGLDGLKNIAFYWHRHPGNSAHSGTDDIDTFETFMSIEAKRKYFIFLQTAVGSDGWNQEARIDVRLPVRHTILDKDIEIEVEEKPEDQVLRAKCEAIAEKCIVKTAPVKSSAIQNYRHFGNKGNFPNSKQKTGWDSFESVVRKNRHSNLDEAIEAGRFGEFIGLDSMNNDFLDSTATRPDEKVSIVFENGQATVVAGKKFGLILEQVLGKTEAGKLSNYVRSFKVGKSNSLTMKKYNLQPVGGKYLEMKTSLTRGYLVFCDKILEEIDEDYADSHPEVYMSETRDMSEDEKAIKMLFPAEDRITVDGSDDVKEILDILDDECSIDWESVYLATVYDYEYKQKLGTLSKDQEATTLVIEGKDLCLLLQDGESLMYGDERDEMEEDDREEEE